MKILIGTDAWTPQVNGVVRSLESLRHNVEKLGHQIDFITPKQFFSFPMPTYPEISLALATRYSIRKFIDQSYDHVHISTEGPIGLSLRSFCIKESRRFTTSYHTRFPEYINTRFKIPVDVSYAALRRFHNAGAGTMVSTESVSNELQQRGFRRLFRWSRGVDHKIFSPEKAVDLGLPKPIFLYVGRLAVEKNIEAFLKLNLPGSKIVVGEGPAKSRLQATFPDVTFMGLKVGAELATIYASSDVFVFPSLTDTFGMVLLEAIACGCPVAAYPVMGPVDVIGNSGAGVLDENLEHAAIAALRISKSIPRDHALTYTWEKSAEQFLDNVVLAKNIETKNTLTNPNSLVFS